MDNPDSPESQDKVGIHTFWNPTVSCHIFCSCSRNVWFLGTFPKYNWYEIIRRYLPKLEFKYFESQLFHFKAIDFSDYRNQWLLCTIPKYKLNSLPFYWPNLEFKCLEIQLFPVTGLFGSRQYVWLLFQKYWILQSLGYLPKLELHSFLYQNSSKIFIITTFVVNNFRNQNHME